MLMRQLCMLLLFSPLLLVAQQRRVSAFIFQPEWYAGLHAGVNMMVAEGFPSYNWLQSTGVSARPVIGYQFSPALGVRGILGVQSHRWNDTRSNGNDSVLSFGSQTLQADIMLNATNLLFGYTLNAPLDVSIFAGVGALHRNTILPDNGYFSYLIRGGIVMVDGYADNVSDGESKSAELSKQRAINVANTLIRKYSIDKERVSVDWYGARLNAALNKMVLVKTSAQ